ncbi:uncharacterized protein LOC143288903 [Babylonia areolata]|uniref:uncharacterized protein LOC143288903 n=1 Tax=Babylonia areolata TaxID=304850 RepID=UPI003FD450BF
MPAKRRHGRRKKHRRCKAAAAEDVPHTGPAACTERGQATECCECHRSHQPLFACPLPHRLSEQGTEDTSTSDVNSPDESLSSKVSVAIGRVKNLWLSADTNGKPADSVARYCSVHKEEKVEFWCQKCKVLMCLFCKLAEHEGHESRSAGLVAAEARQRVVDASNCRLRDFEDHLNMAVKENKKRGDDFRKTQKKTARSILRRHAQLSEIIDKYRDSALLELEALTVGVEACLEEDDSRLKTELKAVSGLRELIDNSLSGTDTCSILSLDREIQENWSPEKIMVRRSVASPSYVYKVGHVFQSAVPKCSTASITNMLQADGAFIVSDFEKIVDGFIGHAGLSKTLLPKVPSNVKITPMFHCCEDPEALVLSVCPIGAKKMAVSYSTSTDCKEGVTKSFFQDGRPSKSFDFGLCTLCAEGNGVFCPLPYFKQFWGECFHFMAAKSGSKQALAQTSDGVCVLASYFRLPFPFCKIYGRGIPSNMFVLSCEAVAPLNFDVTSSGDVVALVDIKNPEASPLDNNLKNNSRVVKVISFSGDLTFTDVYKPPSPNFVPSDVCFFSLDDRPVLLVSDLATSSIHVLSIRPVLIGTGLFRTCQFQRYLVADCELLKQPTALNTDEEGRVWVACKGGQLLTVELVR